MTKINHIFIMTALLTPSFSSFSDIKTEYSQLSKKFIVNYMSDVHKASEIALEQLDIDPSDSTALLRLALSINAKQCSQIKTYYVELGSEDEIREIARSVLKKRCKF